MSNTTASPPLSWVLGAAGPPVELRHKGLTWRLGHPVQSARELLENFLAAQAIAEVNALRDTLDPQDYAAAKKDVLSLVTGKWYSTGGKGWVAAVEGPEGGALFVLALLRVHQPHATVADVKALLADKLDELTLALEQVAPDFFLALTDEADPAAARGAKAKEMYAGFFAGLRKLSATRASRQSPP